ncbi:AAA family ATPase [Pseudomonas sp. AU12215]|uniref:AAA family ATPase n=1 Tax=Pseudomonas sp. AU12215 TaxID=1860123 RepID=UPI0007EE8FF4|nr:ATP-binding protein [Pseudomonas sp. AU12215]OBY60431.1 DNA transposition protein [Pseudomonas sp. AU12215]
MSNVKIAPLTNVGLLSSAIDRALQRPLGLPGLVVMFGASGLGKSVSAAVAANRHRAYYVECRDAWTKKAFLLAILREMGLVPSRTLSEMVDQVAEQLTLSGRPLLVDDAQYLLDKAVANVITDLHNASQGTIVLIGEKGVPASLAKLERLHNRVLEWVPAQPATLDDLRTLAETAYPGLEIEDELLDDLRRNVRGSLRRAAVNLYRINSEAQAHGVKSFGMELWGNRGWFTGEAPAAQRA